MQVRRYSLPDFLVGIVSQEKYERWLRRKTATLVRRDRKRAGLAVKGEAYRLAIHEAVAKSGGRDAYTGEPLDWTLLGLYDNAESKAGRSKYKARFALLPTIDHVDASSAAPNFMICSWRVNDAKNDLTREEFVQLCCRVVDFHRKRP
jgi:hypothetical protein